MYLCKFILFYGRVSQGLLAATTAESWTKLKQVRPPYPYKESSHSLTDDEVLSYSSDHVDVCQILESRMGVLKQARDKWSVSEPKVRSCMTICVKQEPLCDWNW